MALLLSLESSTQVCSVALHQHGKLISHRQIQEPRKAASLLAVGIQQVLAESKVSAAELQGVVVTSGPGSFTGLRIGVATAKGICLALNIPLMAINTLDLLAWQASIALESSITGDEFLCPMLDARRMEVYCKLVDAQRQTVEITQALIIDEETFKEQLNTRVIYFFGEGAGKCQAVIKHPNARFLDGLVPQAKDLGVLGFSKWEHSYFEDVITFEPFYLKDFLIRKPTTG